MASAPRQFVLERTAALEFSLVGIAPARPSDYAEHFVRWLAQGRQGEMAYLARHLDLRLDPARLLPNAKSIICVADAIGSGGKTDEPNGGQGKAARVARYAQVTDYHKVIKKRLHRLADDLREHWPDEQFRACVDTAPLLEREHAQRGGLGWVGKHTLLIHPKLGSHLLLGALLTTLPIEPDTPMTDHCGTCVRCIDACPTHCITPYSVDASRCISYLTIEHRSPIDADLHEAMGDWLFGCDECQQVCPFVQRAMQDESPNLHPAYGPLASAFDPADVANWSEDDRREALQRSAMKRAKLDMLHRNANIVLSNRST